MPSVERLRKRADFVACSQGRQWRNAAFIAQLRANGLKSSRLGFTVSKKNGNAVIRNRIRRRLKAAAARLGETAVAPGHDVVIVARPPALTLAFTALEHDLGQALAGLRRGAGRSPSLSGKGRPPSGPERDDQ